MKKRYVLAGIFAASILGPRALDHKADDWFGICEPNDEVSFSQSVATNMDEVTIPTMFAQVNDEHRYIGLLDTDHRVTDIPVDAYSDAFIEQYLALDVRTFFIESAVQSQVYIDRFLNGNITSDQLYTVSPMVSMWIQDPEEAKAHHDYVTGQMQKMHDAGISIHAVDDQSNIPRIPAYIGLNYIVGASEVSQEHCGTSEVSDNLIIYYALSRTWMTAVALPALAPVLDARMDDVDLARRMEQITEENGGRSAIFYGGGHFQNHDTSYVSVIGPESFYNIALVNNGNYDRDAKIDAVLDVDSDTAYINLDSADADLQNVPEF